VVDLPIACSLDAKGAAERRVEWARLIRETVHSQVETPTGVKLSFSAGPDVEHRLQQLVELERECCAFARWTVTRERNEVVLRVDGQGEGATAVQELFRR
jgi:hypothetical protein